MPSTSPSGTSGKMPPKPRIALPLWRPRPQTRTNFEPSSMNWNESMDRVNRDEPQQCFKLVAIDSEGRYVSIFDGTTEYKVGETITQEVRAGECAGSSRS